MILEIILSAFLLSTTISGAQEAVENQDSLALVNAVRWENGDNGISRAAFTLRLFDVPATVSIARYPMSDFRTSIVDCQDTLAAATSVTASKYGALAAVNGSFFDMKKLTPVTYFYKDGCEIYSEAPGRTNVTDALLCIGGNGHDIAVIKADTVAYANQKEQFSQILAAGPLLVQGGRACAIDTTIRFNLAKAPRTVLGHDGKDVWMIVIDGRFPDTAVGTTIPQTALVCKWLGLKEAINLDGGGSSTLWQSDTGVMNHPCNNHTWDHNGERRVPNIIVCIPRLR